MRDTNIQLKGSREMKSQQLYLLGWSWWGCGVESDRGAGKGRAGFLGKVPFKELWALKGEVRKELCVEKTTRAKAYGGGERRVQGEGWGRSEYLLLGQVGSKHVVGWRQ